MSKSYKITIVTEAKSWIRPHINNLISELEKLGHKAQLVFSFKDVEEGDLAFFLSCWGIAKKEVLAKNKYNLVVHPSALPKGRGMSPLTWQILEGVNDIPITLFAAEEKVDTGKIYLRDVIHFCGDELVDELRQRQGETTIKMCLKFIQEYPEIISRGVNQEGESSYYPRRGPLDSELDVNKSIAEQFNLLRTVDNDSYPAFFIMHGKKYILKILNEDGK